MECFVVFGKGCQIQALQELPSLHKLVKEHIQRHRLYFRNHHTHMPCAILGFNGTYVYNFDSLQVEIQKRLKCQNGDDDIHT